MEITNSVYNILNQLKGLLRQLEDEEYAMSLEILSGSSVGQHSRHIIEFFTCLAAQSRTGVVSYDKRRRDLLLENDKNYMIQTIQEVQSQYSSLTKDYKIDVISNLGGLNHTTPSSYSREILYAIEHAVHHMAIIKIGVNLKFKKVIVSPNFGVAESTIRYLELQ